MQVAKTILQQLGGNRFGIGVYDGVEFIRPWGRFSMSPILRSTDTAAFKPDWE